MQEKIRPGYRQTDVGVIPEDWDVVPIGGLGEVRTGGTPPTNRRELYGGGYLFVSPADIGANKYINRTEKTLSLEGFRSSRIFPAGSSLFVCIGSTIGKVGLAAVDLCSNQQINSVSPGANVDSEFLFYSLVHASPRIAALAGEQAVPIINKSAFSANLIALPGKDEQRAIAEALSDADARILTLETLIAKKRDLKQATMQQLLTGKTRLPGFSGEWEVKRLGEITHVKTGKRNNQDKMETGEFPFFVRSETVERIDSYSYDCEAILVPGEGNIGNIFHYINGKFDVHQRVYAITQFAENVSGKYVHLWMRMNFGAHAMQNTVKATVDSLRLPTFQNFQLLMPPTIDEQTAIAEILSDMDAELAALDAEAEKARTIKQGMMQNLLTGKVRLV